MASKDTVVIPSPGFRQHTVDAFQRLFTQRDLADVTLVCEDLTRVRAHSLVLSLSSPFFASLLQEGSGQGDKVLYLGGLSQDQASALVNLVYLGKAEVKENEVDQFNKLMEDFQVLQEHIKNGNQGLTKKEENPYNEIKVETQIKSVTQEQKLDIQMGYEQIEAFLKIEQKTPAQKSQKWLDKIQARKEALTCHCGFMAKDFDRFETHKVNEHGSREWPCEKCGVVLKKEHKLIRHIKFMHTNDQDRDLCGEDGCDFRSDKKQALLKHKKKIHHGNIFICDVCDYRTWNNGHLMIHKQSKHLGVRFHCDECAVSYPRKNGLSRHIESVHRGIKYYCSQCDYQATTGGNLKIHIYAKHENKRFKCDICDWTGSQMGMVRNHKKQKHENIPTINIDSETSTIITNE